MRTPMGDTILAALRNHRGLENAVTAPQLAVEVGINERDVRRLIANECRHWTDEGLILARPGHGFFFATEAEEILHRQAMLLRLKHEAATKVADFQQLMRATGFGGHVRERPTTFTHESHPEKNHNPS
jgi:hypothetical protein